MDYNYYLGLSPEGFHSLAYTEWGIESIQAPSIICVHGLTRNCRDFDALASFLSNHKRHVLCPDVAGRGNSDWFSDHSNYNFTQYLADMTALINKINAKQLDWIGTSMGGLIGMMIAAMPNNPIRKLVLNDIGAQIPVAGLRRIASYTGNEPVFTNLQEAKDYFKEHCASFGNLNDAQWDTITQNSIKEITPNHYRLKLDPGIKNTKSKKKWLIDFIHNPHQALEGILFDIDLWALWEKVHCPVLLIHGKKSDLLTTDIITKMQDIHPLTEVYTVDDAGHAPALMESEHHHQILQWLSSSL